MTPQGFTCRICLSQEGIELIGGIRDWEYDVAGEFSYIECKNCGAIQLHPFPTPKEVENAYPETYAHYHGFRKRDWLFRVLSGLFDKAGNRWLRRALPPEASVLDVGCGDGEFLGRLREMGARELQGVDISPHAVQAVRKLGFDAFEGLFADFPADAQSYDLIVMQGYLEHSWTPLADLKKASGLLKDDGYLLGVVPNYACLDRKLFGSYWAMYHVPRHLFQFTPDLVRDCLQKTGFETVKIHSLLSPTGYALSIQNYLFRRTPADEKARAMPNGRVKYYSLLSLATFPLHFASLAVSYGGLIEFLARKKQ